MNVLIRYWHFVAIVCFCIPGYGAYGKQKLYLNHACYGMMDTVYHMDMHNNVISQPITQTSLRGHKYQYVEIDIIKLVNPRQYPLTFYVYYQPPAKEKVMLGSFGPYPADNPGKFIVSTHDKPLKDGALILSLVIPIKTSVNDTVKVTVKKLVLREK